MRRQLFGLAIAAFIVAAEGCVPPAAAKSESESAPTLSFSYTPPTSAPAGSAKVTLAVVQPQWAKDDGGDLLEFSTAMKNDFIALLNARGYTTRGPFDSYQAMVFPDKNGSDLILTPELALTWEFSDVKPVAGGSFGEGLLAAAAGGKGPYVVNGTATIRGRVNLLLSESLTNERMWSKSIAVAPVVVKWAGKKKYTPGVDAPLTTTEGIRQFIMSDPGFQRAMYPKLEATYQTILQKGWDYLDPQEIRSVKTQAADLKRSRRD